LIFALAAVSLSPELAPAQMIRTGVLTCDVSGGIGLIIGSQRSVACTFASDQGAPPEAYFGTITKFGLDIGATAGGVMVWGVYSETTRGPGFLAGDYAGASGEATVVAGLGANVLLGGSNRTVALQPVSVGGQVGLNLALGVANLSLRPGR
jgi:hypothetical protein